MTHLFILNDNFRAEDDFPVDVELIWTSNLEFVNLQKQQKKRMDFFGLKDYASKGSQVWLMWTWRTSNLQTWLLNSLTNPKKLLRCLKSRELI